MAKRRMISKEVLDTDRFYDLSNGAKLLYVFLMLDADDEGFIAKPKTVVRVMGVQEDDLKQLVQTGFLIPFKTGVMAITHWHLHNTIRKDRSVPTIFQMEKSYLACVDGVYAPAAYVDGEFAEPIANTPILEWQPADDLLPTFGQPVAATDKNRIDKNRIDKNNIEPTIRSEDIDISSIEEFKIGKPKKERNIIPPTIDMVKAYIDANNFAVDPENFVDYYEVRGWCAGNKKMKDWQAAVRVWHKNADKYGAPKSVDKAKAEQAKVEQAERERKLEDDWDKEFESRKVAKPHDISVIKEKYGIGRG